MSPGVATRIAMATSSKGRSDLGQWRRRANFGSADGAPASNLRIHIFGFATRHVQRPQSEGSGQGAAVVAAVERATVLSSRLASGNAFFESFGTRDRIEPVTETVGSAACELDSCQTISPAHLQE
jgi:hypothetical protein